MPLAPLVLGPNQPRQFYRGGARIAAFRGIAPGSAYAPEDWVGSTTELFGQPGAGLTVLPGGQTLRSVIAADPAGYLGPGHLAAFGADLNLLVKLLDTGQRLVVHCHPARPFARAHLHSAHGKTEAWIVTRVTPDPADDSAGHVYAGFRRDTDPAAVAAWVGAQDTAALLGALNKLPVRPGETCLVPAGLPHAVGSGVTVVEVQEPTDFSILLEWAGYTDGPGDLGLGYPLALQALDCSGWDGERLAGLLGRTPDGPGRVPLLPPAAAPFFRVEQVDASDQPVALPPQVAVLIVLAGRGTLTTESGPLGVTAGMTLFVPYGAGDTRLEGPVRALRCLPPDPAHAQESR
jgi:mannose-6-phosphate isomerase